MPYKVVKDYRDPMESLVTKRTTVCLGAKNHFTPPRSIHFLPHRGTHPGGAVVQPVKGIPGGRAFLWDRTARYHSEAMCVKKNSVPCCWRSSPPSPSFPRRPASNQDQVAEHSRLAQQYLNQHRPDLAIPEFQALVSLEPRNLDAQANLGVLLFFQGDYVKAEPHLRAALDMQPNLTKIQALLGMAEKRTGDTANARTHLETSFAAVDEPKLKVQIGMELVELYTASQDLEKASSVVNAMRQADPANPAVLYAAYRVYSDLAGEAMLSLALAAPDSAQMHQVMAHEEVKQGNNAGARVQFQKALEIDPKLPGIHFELGELLGLSEDPKTKAQAESEYKAAIAENALDEKAETRLGTWPAAKGILPRPCSTTTPLSVCSPTMRRLASD